ncbi:MAG TPA: co-chaperone GroES [Burkholderiaceae bacterium]|nr:co-chaperone GroES [Burkholderiaceae bacterium]
MQIRPLYERIVVKRIDNERKTNSGIVLPDSAAEKPEQGEVLAVGSGKLLEDGRQRPLQLKVGDRVLFGRYAGQTIKVDGQELLVMREDEVFAVIDTAAASGWKKAA